jgi:hypothetical protein
MLRWIQGDSSKTSARTLSEDEFIWEVLQLAERSFSALALEPMLVESIEGPESDVQWRAYLQEPRDLLKLARQLAVERCLRQSSGPGMSNPASAAPENSDR